jgi:hypothetical protein
MTKVEATTRGKQLLAKMRGLGWKLAVWENLGWHYKVSNGDLGVYPNGHSKPYQTYYSLGGNGSAGDLRWTEGAKYSDPNRAAQEQVKLAAKRIMRELTAVAIIQQRLNGVR